MLNHLLLTSVLGFSSSAGQTQQGPYEFLYFEELDDIHFRFTQAIEWPAGTIGPRNVTRTIVGDFDADLRKDVVVLDGGQPMFLYAPVNWAIVHPMPFRAVDFDTAPGAGPNGQDAVALTNNAGLRLATYSPTVNTFVQTTLSGAQAWKQARCVRCADFDGDGQLDYAGLSANGTTLILRLSNGGAVLETTQALPAVAASLCAVQWTSDAANELALVTSQGVLVRAASGLTLASHVTGANARNFIAPVRRAGSELQSLAWVHRAGDIGAYELRLVDPTGVTLQYVLPTSVVNLHSIVPGGEAEDGDTDLLLCSTTEPIPYYAHNQSEVGGTEPPFSINGFGPVQLASSVPLAAELPGFSSYAQPVWTELTGSGGSDLMLWSPSAMEFRFYEAYNPDVHALHGDQLFRGVSYRRNLLAGTDQLVIDLNYFALGLGDPGLTADFHVRVWRQADYYAPLEPVVHYIGPAPLPDSNLIHHSFDANGDPVTTLLLLVDLLHDETQGVGDSCFPAIYWFEFRALYTESNGVTASIYTGDMYAGYLAALPDDVIELWHPCYSLMMEVEGLAECPTAPPASYYSTPSCQSGSTQTVTRSYLGTRRRVLPASESGPVIPQAPPPTYLTAEDFWISP